MVALALFDAAGRLLLQQRPPGKHHAGCWEFPGGKVEPGETPREALVREIAEELAITIDPADLASFAFAEEAAPAGTAPPGTVPAVTAHPMTGPIVLLLYTARRWSGIITGLEGQRWGWHDPPHAAHLALAPMDRALLAQLARGTELAHR